MALIRGTGLTAYHMHMNGDNRPERPNYPFSLGLISAEEKKLNFW